jgi:hypothetical protein
MEAAEERGGAGSVETLVVIEDPNLQDGAAPAKTASDGAPVGNLLAYREGVPCQVRTCHVSLEGWGRGFD